MARCRGKHAELISQWGCWLHRLVRLHRAISHYPYVIMIDSKAVFSSHCAEPVTYKAMKTCPSLQMFKPASSILLLHGMNTLRPILLALTAAAALSFAQPASANLITNPGFETGDFTGWSQVNGTVLGPASGISPHSGNFQATFGDAPASLAQSVATTPGASYTIDFWLANQGIPMNNFSVSWDGSPIFSLTNQSSFGYTEYTFTETASIASTALLFQFGQQDGVWLLDDVSVNPAGVGVPDAGSTFPLLGFALLGLAALRCKLSLLRVAIA